MMSQWWTIWNDGDICSRHSSYDAAFRAARACERLGGAEHKIVQVTECDYKPRRKSPKREAPECARMRPSSA
jgi:hypothetical protein